MTALTSRRALSCALVLLYMAGAAFAERRVELRPSGFESTEQGRKTLSYIVSCALEAEVTAVATYQGREYSFRGGEGLAPAWTGRPMTEAEQRWVSACLLARTNAFGIRIPIYLYAGAGAVPPALREREGAGGYTLFEGMFFGNVFAREPVAFACHAPGAAGPHAAGILSQRVCAQPLAERPGFSACDFRITGTCGEPGALSAGGREWPEVMQVWLQPDR